MSAATLLESLKTRRSVLESLSDSDLAAVSFAFEMNPDWEDVYIFANGEIENGEDHRSFCSTESRVMSIDRENTKLYPRAYSSYRMHALSRGIPMNVSRTGMRFYSENSNRVFRCQM